MLDLKKLQKETLELKKRQGFNTSNIEMEFCLIHEEVSEAFRAYYSKLPDLGEEIADIAIYLAGLSEILGIDLETEIIAKMAKNQKREYQKIDGVLKRTKEAE